MFCINILNTLSFLLAAKTQLPWQKSNSIRRQTPKIIGDLHYFRFIRAGQHLETHVWTTNKAEVIHKKTYSRAAQMSSPILSLKATWSNAIRTETFKSPVALRRRPTSNAASSQTTPTPSGWPTSRPIPEEMSVLATGLLCLSLSVSCVIPEERVSTTHADSDCVSLTLAQQVWLLSAARKLT